MKSAKETAEKIIGMILEREDLETADAGAILEEITTLAADEASSMMKEINDSNKAFLAKLFIGHVINMKICEVLKKKAENDQKIAKLVERLNKHAEKALEEEE